MTIPEPPSPDVPSDPDVPHPGPTDPRGPRPDGPPVEPPMRPLEPYDPSEPGAPTPGTRAGTPPLPDIESAYDFRTLDALRQLREQFPHSRILLDLDSQTPEIVVKVEAPPSIVARVGDEPGSDASRRDGAMPEAATRAATAARR